MASELTRFFSTEKCIQTLRILCPAKSESTSYELHVCYGSLCRGHKKERPWSGCPQFQPEVSLHTLFSGEYSWALGRAHHDAEAVCADLQGRDGKECSTLAQENDKRMLSPPVVALL